MIYLASPYAHEDHAVMQQRYERMVKFVHKAYTYGKVVYSPIVHNHPVALLGNLPRTWDFWRKIDIPILNRCDMLWVIHLKGWDKSKGVRAEMDYAIAFGIPVQHYSPNVISF